MEVKNISDISLGLYNNTISEFTNSANVDKLKKYINNNNVSKVYSKYAALKDVSNKTFIDYFDKANDDYVQKKTDVDNNLFIIDSYSNFYNVNKGLLSKFDDSSVDTTLNVTYVNNTKPINALKITYTINNAIDMYIKFNDNDGLIVYEVMADNILVANILLLSIVAKIENQKITGFRINYKLNKINQDSDISKTFKLNTMNLNFDNAGNCSIDLDGYDMIKLVYGNYGNNSSTASRYYVIFTGNILVVDNYNNIEYSKIFRISTNNNSYHNICNDANHNKDYTYTTLDEPIAFAIVGIKSSNALNTDILSQYNDVNSSEYTILYKYVSNFIKPVVKPITASQSSCYAFSLPSFNYLINYLVYRYIGDALKDDNNIGIFKSIYFKYYPINDSKEHPSSTNDVNSWSNLHYSALEHTVLKSGYSPNCTRYSTIDSQTIFDTLTTTIGDHTYYYNFEVKVLSNNAPSILIFNSTTAKSYTVLPNMGSSSLGSLNNLILVLRKYIDSHIKRMFYNYLKSKNIPKDTHKILLKLTAPTTKDLSGVSLSDNLRLVDLLYGITV